MKASVSVSVLRVFVDDLGYFGNPVGVVVDGSREIAHEERQKIATKLGFSECVFINNLNTGDVSIFNPKTDVNFSGYAMVGTAHFIRNSMNKSIELLNCKNNSIKTWQERDMAWIRACLKETPPWRLQELQNASLVNDFQTTSINHTVVWAWIDRAKGVVRARTFAPDWGIPEDEANGSGSMQLAVILDRKLEIHHGKGSIIYAKPAGNGSADLGGKVIEATAQYAVV